MNAQPPPAGWYPDPAGRAPFRYWDGTRWTEHTQQRTDPAPVPQQPFGQQPIPAPSPYGGGAPTPAPYQTLAPNPFGTPAPQRATTGPVGPMTAQSFVEDLKKFEGLAVVVIGALLVIIASFLPWLSTEATNAQTGAHFEDSVNAWDGGGPWLIRGTEVTVENLQKAQANQSTDGGTDMVLLLPLTLAAAGIAVALKLGKPVNKGTEILLGVTGLLALLLIIEAVHISGQLDDFDNLMGSSSSLGFGVFIAIFGALVTAVGALRHFQAAKLAVG